MKKEREEGDIGSGGERTGEGKNNCHRWRVSMLRESCIATPPWASVEVIICRKRVGAGGGG